MRLKNGTGMDDNLISIERKVYSKYRILFLKVFLLAYTPYPSFYPPCVSLCTYYDGIGFNHVLRNNFLFNIKCYLFYLNQLTLCLSILFLIYLCHFGIGMPHIFWLMSPGMILIMNNIFLMHQQQGILYVHVYFLSLQKISRKC